ncbi:MAG: PD40 domain-containing protein [Armatimonadetes bacterium]|nr:PD40 domain-containing protein [Armatimonadota bacterium]
MGTYKANTYGSDSASKKAVVSLRFAGTEAKSVKVWLDASSVDLMAPDGTVTPRVDLSDRGYTFKGTIVDAYRVAYALGTENENESNVYSAGEENNGIVQLTAHSLDSYSGSYNYDGTQIIFVSDRGGRKQIYRANADGSGAVVLTPPDQNAIDPHWCKVTNPLSASFNKIVYASDLHGGWQLYTMNADGTGRTRLTNRTTGSYDGDDYSPAWSYDGTRIAFVSTRNSGAEQIYRILSNGTGTTAVLADGFSNIDPSYSPVTNTIAFSSNRTGSYDIYTVLDDGTSLARVTQTGRDATQPAWVDNDTLVFVTRSNATKNLYTVQTNGTSMSRVTYSAENDGSPEANPAGSLLIYDTVRDKFRCVVKSSSTGVPITRLTQNSPESFCPAFDRTGEFFAFCSDRGTGAINLYYTGSDLDINSATQITNNTSVSWQPTWSVDGNTLAFSTNRDGNFQIYSIGKNGTGQTRLVNNAFDCTFPTWVYASSPVNERIAYMSNATGSHQVYLMHTNGTSQTQLTSSGTNIWPSASPDGTKIAFASNRGGGEFMLYVMNADGTGQTALGSHVVSSPVTWSGDSQQLAFNRDNFEIYTVDASSGEVIARVTHNSIQEFYMAWDPDGTVIVFDSENSSGRRSLKYIDPTVGEEVSVDSTDSKYGGSWSHDGSSIVFSRINASGRERLYQCDFDGDDKTLATIESVLDDRMALYAPSANRLYFERKYPGLNTSICYLTGNTVTVQYTTPYSTEVLLDVSSDGSRQLLGYGGKLFELNGTTLTELLTSDGLSIGPTHACYNPDRKRIGLIMPGGIGTYPLKPQIFLYTISTKRLVKVTDTDTEKSYISWRAKSPELMYTDEVSAGVHRLHILKLNGSGKQRFITLGTDDSPTTAEIGGRWCADGQMATYQRVFSSGAAESGAYLTQGPTPGGILSSGAVLTSPYCSYDQTTGTAYFSATDSIYEASGIYSKTGYTGAFRHTNFGYNDRFGCLNPDKDRIVVQSMYMDTSGAVQSIYIADSATPWDRELLKTSAEFPDWGSNDTILYTSPQGLRTINPNGSGDAAVPNTVGATQGRWSADATKITFVLDGSVWVCDSDGSNAVEVAAAVSVYGNRSPSFTPDGQEVVFEAVSPNGNGQIYRVEAVEGGEVSEVSFPGKWPRMDYLAGRVLYSKELVSSNVLAWRNIDGTEETELTESFVDDIEPRYNPATNGIVYSSNSPGTFQLYSMTSSGGSITRLMTNSANDRQPAVTNAGDFIAFASDRGTNSNQDIYRYQVSDQSVVRLTTSTGEDYKPCWNNTGSKIVFVSTRTGASQIWVMDNDGANQTQITTLGHNECPVVSPDGSTVLFVSDRSGQWKLYQVPIAGGTETLVYTGDKEVRQVAWRSDAGQIAFVGGTNGHLHIYTRNTPLGSSIEPVALWTSGENADVWYGESDAKIVFSANIDGQAEIYKVAVAGAGEVSLARSSYANAYQPAWNLDGTRLAYVSQGNGGVNIFTLDAETDELAVLTTSVGTLEMNLHPKWEPVSSNPRIAYQTNVSTVPFTVYGFSVSGFALGNFGIAVMNDDGTQQMYYTDPNTSDSVEPAWSPDGAYIYFARRTSGNYELCRVTSSGTGQAVYFAPDGNSHSPCVHPTDGSLAYSNDRTGESQIYVYDAENGTDTRLTHNTSECTAPQWTPDGEFVIYTKESPEGEKSLWRIKADGTGDEEWYDPDGVEAYDAASTLADAFGSVVLQDPSAWPDLPLDKDSAWDFGLGNMNRRMIGQSKKLAVVIKPPSSEGPLELVNLRLRASFQV